MAKAKKKTARRTSKVDLAYTRLEKLIVTLQLPPGALFMEAEIVDLCELGRTPVRQALHRLELQGLVTVHARQGVMISSIDVIRQLDVLEVRRSLMHLLAKCALTRASEDDRQRILELADQCNEARQSPDNLDLFVKSVSALQKAIDQAGGNDYLTEMLGTTYILSNRFWYAYGQNFGDLDRGIKLHVALAQAITQGNEDKAAAAVDQLLDYIEEFTRSVVDRRLLR